ncbi:MAG: 5'-3' exonuclease H3TH domain-containing protein, partial [Paracoccaceae bacterium]
MGTSFGKGHHLHLIDGSAFIFRAYHALPPLTRKSDGLPIGAVAGFCNLLWSEISKDQGIESATHIAVIFDHSSKTFRNEIYPLYKANRPDLPEDLRPQFPLTREATRAFNVACIERENYEADDIIATLARQAAEAGGLVTIISSDKDLMQLVNTSVCMRDPMKNKKIGTEEVFEKFGVAPDRVIDVQALSGDSVDNVPGAPGIGIKTAALLIQEYGDLETLLTRAAEIKQPKRREALLDNVEQIRMSKRLVSLDGNTPLDFTLDSLEVKAPNPDQVLAFLNAMEFRTLTQRVATSLKVAAPAIAEAKGIEVTGAHSAATVPTARPFNASDYECVKDETALARWIAHIRVRGYVAVDTETTSLDEMRAELVGISLCV